MVGVPLAGTLGRGGSGRGWVMVEARNGLRAVLRSPIYVLSLVQVFIGAGAGLFINYFNLYFVDYLKASSALFGVLNGGTIAIAALCTLAAPWLAQRIGRVNAIALTQLASIPLLITLGLTTMLPLAALCFLISPGVNGYVQWCVAGILDGGGARAASWYCQ